MVIIFPPILPGVKSGRHVVEIEGELFRFDGGRDHRFRSFRDVLRRQPVAAVGQVSPLPGFGLCPRFGRGGVRAGYDGIVLYWRGESASVVDHVVDEVLETVVVHKTSDSRMVGDGGSEALFEITAADGSRSVCLADDGPQMPIRGHMVGDGVHRGVRSGAGTEHILDVVAHARAFRAQKVRVEARMVEPCVVDRPVSAVEPLGQFLEHAFAHDGVHRSGDRVEIVAVSHGERFDGLAERGPRVDAASFRIVREFVGVPVPDAGFETIHAIPVEWFRRRIRG